MSLLRKKRAPSREVASRHPNELDMRRIAKGLAKRKRYRYVLPSVRETAGGYLIESPCCSRTVDPDGGVIDVARIEYHCGALPWQLFERDHGRGSWKLHSAHANLSEVLECLNVDAQREFWK